jgi:peptidyl-prolyl cis-trans isomerase C
MTKIAQRPWRRQFPLSISGLILAVGAWGAPIDPSTVLVSARGEQITVADWREHMEMVPRYARSTFADRDRAERMVRSILRDLLQERVELSEAEEAGLSESEETRVLVAHAGDRVLAERARSRAEFVQFELSDEELDRAVAERIAEFQSPDKIRFRHLFLDLVGLSPEEREAKRSLAAELEALLREAPGRFVDLMVVHSDSEMSSPENVLGPVGPDEMLEELSGPLWELEEGEVSAVVESRFGLHLFQVVGRVKQSPSPQSIRNSVRGALRREGVQERVDELLARAEIDLGLVMHESPARLEPDTVIISGARTITGADLAMAREIALEDFPEGGELAQIVRQDQEQTALAALARREQWDQEPEIREAVRSARRGAVRSRLIEHRVETLEPVTGEMVRAHHEDNLEAFTEPIRLWARLLELRPGLEAERGQRFALREIQDEASALRRRWEEGDAFEDLVREAGQDPEPRWIYPRGLDARLGVAADLATGEVSQPIRLADGYALVEALGVEANHLRPLDEELAEQIRSFLELRARRRQPLLWVEELDAEMEWSIPEELVDEHVVVSEADEEPPA